MLPFVPMIESEHVPPSCCGLFCQKFSYRMVGQVVNAWIPPPVLALFDYPNPNATSEQRMTTVGPMQRLYFMNNSFVAQQAKALADRLTESDNGDVSCIEAAYQLLFGRMPTDSDIQMGLEFLDKFGRGWTEYAQVLLSSAEFSSVN